MPVYEYDCKLHGVFEQLRPIAEHAALARCPSCRRRAARVLSAPQSAALAPSERIARERNERSQHEPRIASTPGESRPNPKKPLPARPHAHRAPSRPWMLGHG